jgi:hypothetical protein
MTFGRSTWSPPPRARDLPPPAPSVLPKLHRGSYEGGTSGTAIAKEDSSQSSPYMTAAKALGYCMRCGCACRPQFCHRDEGKGMGIKTDCREGWAGCAGCHFYVGTSGKLPKEQRRAEDLRLGAKTRAELIKRGTWPKSVPMWAPEMKKEQQT